MFAPVGQRLTASGRTVVPRRGRRLRAATKPNAAPFVVATLADVPQSKRAPIAENALLRPHLLILQRSVKRPRCRSHDRALLVLLASRVRAGRQALVIGQPDPLLRWLRPLLSVGGTRRWRNVSAKR
jgi:hypothetical protein